MPEYLSPGVYIEEVPARLKAIEGVSTSTVGFVGVARRGPVPGYDLPFDADNPEAGAGGVAIPLPRDAAPPLVTSHAEFERLFGPPLPMPDPNGNAFLAPAVRAFFNNGGKRCYISRVVHSSDEEEQATRSRIRLHQGVVLRLTRPVRAGDRAAFLNSTRGIAPGAVIMVVARSNGRAIYAAEVDTCDIATGRLALRNIGAGDVTDFTVRDGDLPDGIDIAEDLDPADVCVVRQYQRLLSTATVEDATEIGVAEMRGIGPGRELYLRNHEDQALRYSAIVAACREESGEFIVGLTNIRDAADEPVEHLGAIGANEVDIISADVTGSAGPLFHARTPGSWGNLLRVEVRPSDRPPVRISRPVAADQRELPVGSTGSFYRGAIVEINAANFSATRSIVDVLPNVLLIDDALGAVIPSPASIRILEIDIALTDESGPQPTTEVFRGLTWNPSNLPETRRRYYATVINNRSRLVYVQPPAYDGDSGMVEEARLASQPTTASGFDTVEPTTPGSDDFDAISANDYIGEDRAPEMRSGIHALSALDEVSIIACPGRSEDTVHNALITQCENQRYRFAVLDADPLDGTVTDVLEHRNLYDSSYAAYYYPWVEVKEGGEQILLPPSGHVAGIYARTDIERGVFKAPANEVVRNVTGLQSYVTTGEQDVLNPRGVNVIRKFEGRGIRVWGARTLSSNPEFRYISTRRFLIFLEKSIDRGTQWVVFEPNHADTWSRVTDSVSAFLHTQWLAAVALLGRTPEQAFFVRCDESTMTADDIENGRLICNIGVAIVKPAEFVVFRIEQITSFSATT